MAEIIRTDGARVLVDEEDVERVSQFSWFPCGWKGRYVGTHVVRNGKQTTMYLHRFILNVPRGIEADHKNRDPLDNRRSNLRLATRGQNEQNKGLTVRNTTGFRGVETNRNRPGRFHARVQVDGVPHSFGVFGTVEEAGAAAARGRALLMTHSEEASVMRELSA